MIVSTTTRVITNTDLEQFQKEINEANKKGFHIRSDSFQTLLINDKLGTVRYSIVIQQEDYDFEDDEGDFLDEDDN